MGGFFVAVSPALAAATVTPVGNGTNISIDTSSAATSPSWKSLGGPGFGTENGDIAIGIHTITLPTGWEFNVGSSIVITPTNDIIFASTSITPGSTFFSFEVTTKSTYAGTIIFGGLKVRPTGTVSGITGNMTYSGAGIVGVDGNTNFGTLSTIPGTITKVAFTTQPGAATVYGSNLSVQPIVKTQDQFGNDSTNGLGADLNLILTLTSGTGTLLGTTSLPIGTNSEATPGTVGFADLYVDTFGAGKQLTATAIGLVPAVSSIFEITQKPLTATVVANSKEYEGNATAIITSANLSDLAYSDDVTANISAALASFSDANAGTGKTVTATGITLDGIKASNYSFNNTGTGAADINKKSIIITPYASQNKIYGNTNPDFSFSYAPFLIGSDGFTGALSRAIGENVGTYAYNLDILSAGSNYSLAMTASPATFEITKKDLTVIATGVSREYNGTLVATVTLSTNDKISGDVLGTDLILNYSSASFSDKTAADGKQINVSGISIDGAKAGNYNLLNSTTTASANITKRSITATLNLNNKTYDGDTGAIYASETHVLLHDIISGDTVTISSDGSKAYLDKNVGTNKIVNATGIILGGDDAGNYQFNGTGTGTATIIARPITVTAVSGTKVYNGTPVSDGVPAVTSTFSPAVAAVDTKNFIQTYDTENFGTGKTLTPTGSVSDGNNGLNYAITFAPVSTGEITAKPLTATVTVQNKVVDGNTTATILTRTPVGVESGDTIVLSGGVATFTNATVANGKNVTASGITIISGNEAGNYSYDGAATGTGNIRPIPTTVYVDGTFTEASAAAAGHTLGYDAFITIQAGIDAVDVGGTVNIAAGTYAEKILIDGKTNLTIQGEGDGSLIEPAYNDSGTAGITIKNSNGLTINDIK